MAAYFSRLKRGERGGDTLLELYHALGRDMCRSTMMGAARCIDSHRVMWYSATRRYRRHRLKGTGASYLFARRRHMPSTFLFIFNFIYANTKLPFTHTILMEKFDKKTKKSLKLSYRLFDSKGMYVSDYSLWKKMKNKIHPWSYC